MIEQGTPEWHAQRLGKATASRIADVVARTKSGPAASRKNYLAELVAERLTGNPSGSGFTNSAMQWGTETEPQARGSYQFVSGLEVEPAPFVEHPTIEMSGASPDGFVGDNGLVEIKCPNTATHIDTLLNGTVPGKYETQMHWQMACTGRAWCDFVSFDPRLPLDMQIFVARYERDEDRIAELETAVSEFLAEVQATVESLTERYRNAA